MQGLLQMADENKLVSWLPVRWTPPMRLVTGCSCDRKARHSSTRGVQGWFRRTRLVSLAPSSFGERWDSRLAALGT
jgi:hypothetical protein